MSIVKDMKLADSGMLKISWAADHMPALNAIKHRFLNEKPFKGLRIAMSVHLEAKTAQLGLVLKAGGAEVFLTGSNPLSTQDDVAAAMAGLGVETFGIRQSSMASYEDMLAAVLKCHPHLIVDDGGDLVSLLSGKCSGYADCLIGGCEETTTGIHRLHAREKAGTLPCAMMAVNDAKAKHYYDNKYGTGQSVWDAIMHLTNLCVAGKTVVVAGYGWCGRGIAMRAKGLGADVIVTEVDPIKALEATMENCRVMPMYKAAETGDIFITATGCRDVITGEHFEFMKNNAILCNAGHFDCEVSVSDLEGMAVRKTQRREGITGYEMPGGRTLNLLAEGRLVNLAGGNGHPAEIMDMSFSVQALALEWLVKHRDMLERKVYQVSDQIDTQIAWLKLQEQGMSIDRLTEEQVAYLQHE